MNEAYEPKPGNLVLIVEYSETDEAVVTVRANAPRPGMIIRTVLRDAEEWVKKRSLKPKSDIMRGVMIPPVNGRG